MVDCLRDWKVERLLAGQQIAGVFRVEINVSAEYGFQDDIGAQLDTISTRRSV